MPRHTLPVRAVSLDDPAAPSYEAFILRADADDRERLEHALGPGPAADVLRLMERGEMSAAWKEFNLLRWGDRAVLFLGLGAPPRKRPYRRDDQLRALIAIATRHFRRIKAYAFTVGDLSDLGVPPERAATLIVEGALLGSYRYDVHRTRGHKAPMERLYVRTGGDVEALQQALELALIRAESVCFARDLINAPSSELKPMDFAAHARALAQEIEALSIEVLGQKALEEAGMGMHLAVARGSDAEPCLCVLRYHGRGLGTPWDLAIVGKGVTFDTGGYGMKSNAGMRRMYRDMAGAGAAIGAMRAIALAELELNVVAVIPLAENMISGEAFRPGDILTSRKGFTVEVAHTDAEGRLLLGDALTYTCDHFAPKTIVDVATLTGAVRTALGLFVSGLFTHSEDDDADMAFAALLYDAGCSTGEWVWRLPVDDDYAVQLRSSVADMSNCSTDAKSGAGAITAAVFLKQFIDFDVVRAWAHLDIAATAFMERTVIYNKVPYMPREGATGVGVRLLTELAARLSADIGGDLLS